MPQFKIVAAKRWKGTVDKSAIDSAKLFAEIKLDGSRNGKNGDTDAWAGGVCTEEIRLPAHLWDRAWEQHAFPWVLDLGTERTSNGKTSREVVIAARMVGTDVSNLREVAPSKKAA